MVSGWGWQVEQSQDSETGFENFLNPFKMTESQSEGGNHCILRSRPLRSVGTCASEEFPATLYEFDLVLYRPFSRLLG